MVIIGMDPPDHRTFRTLVSKAFTPKVINQIEPALRSEARRVAAELREGTRCDVVPDVAARIPMWSISELMGVPEPDRQRLYELSHALIDDQDLEIAPTPETSMMASAEIFAYATEMAERARSTGTGTGTGDITSALVNAEVDGRSLTDLEFCLFFIFLIVAGNETTRTATSHGLVALLDHPDQLEQLREDPRRIPAAVEEIIRWQPPIHHFRRTATSDIEIGGKKVAAGDKVIMWYASANRDNAVIDHPHTFRIDRTPNPQLSFGIGEHFCLGASLARLSLTVIFEELLAAIDDIELAAPPRRLHSTPPNGIKELQITYRSR
jgi:cholest-4-en-3-one 26-monooxygenase